MVVLDATIVNIALPSAQPHCTSATTDRQWMVTAYALAFGSLLLLGGRLADLIGPQDHVHRSAWPASPPPRRSAGRRAASPMLVGARASRERSARCWRRPRCRCSPRRSAGRRSGPGVRHLRRDRRRGRRGGPAAGRRADRVPELALVPVRQPDLRGGRRQSARSPCSRASQPPPVSHRRPRLDLPGVVLAPPACSAWSTASPTRPATAGTPRPPGASWSPAASCSPCSCGGETRAAEPLLPLRLVLDRNRAAPTWPS